MGSTPVRLFGCLLCSVLTGQVVHFHAARGLRQEGVVLLEDGRPRPVTLFLDSARESKPVDVILLFDESSSVLDSGLLNPLLFRQILLNQIPNSRIAVYSFKSSLNQFLEPSADFDKLSRAFQALQSGSTPAKTIRKGLSLYEAIAAAAEDSRNGHGAVARTMIVFAELHGTKPADVAEV